MPPSQELSLTFTINWHLKKMPGVFFLKMGKTENQSGPVVSVTY